jgi:hypothetical protein
MRRSVALLVVLFLATSTIIIAQPISAQTTPSVPEFSLKFVDNSYDYKVPPEITTAMNPFTGITNSTTKPGYTVHVENKSIIITIRNQVFTPSSGNQYLLYAVNVKGHYVEFWGTLLGEGTFRTQDWFPQQSEPPKYPSAGDMPKQSNSDYTVLNYSVNSFAAGSQMDFQVQAVTGYDAQAWYNDPDHPLAFGIGSMGPIIAVNQRSGWSKTQTITIPQPLPSETPTLAPTSTTAPILATSPTESTSTPSPIITPTPTQVVFQSVPTWFYPVIAGLIAVIAVLLGIIASTQRKNRGLKQ